ncbi:MAG: alpha-L-arabinofuranosidase C-terminal domain-containing protein [Tepidisphaeraceae bacterium]
MQEFDDGGFRALPSLFASAVRDSKSGDTVLKIVNNGAERALQLDLQGLRGPMPATKTVLTGDPMAVNDIRTERPVLPVESTMSVDKSLSYTAPANSLTVIRFPGKQP